MSNVRIVLSILTSAAALGAVGCDEEPKKSETAKSAKAKATAAPAPSASAAAKVEVKRPSHECPEGSEGEGTVRKPCKAEGTTRIMDVTWNGKIKDKGPVFKVISKSDIEIPYGKVVVYFYDKAGKQIQVKQGDKERPYLTCTGRIFAGAVKPKEKIFVNFSCVKKDAVPEDAKAIEAEISQVGFTEKDGKNVDTYWRNDDLAPKERPKGGIKAKKK